MGVGVWPVSATTGPTPNTAHGLTYISNTTHTLHYTLKHTTHVGDALGRRGMARNRYRRPHFTSSFILFFFNSSFHPCHGLAPEYRSIGLVVCKLQLPDKWLQKIGIYSVGGQASFLFITLSLSCTFSVPNTLSFSLIDHQNTSGCVAVGTGLLGLGVWPVSAMTGPNFKHRT